jgi:tyrosyl-tRNA synthetase
MTETVDFFDDLAARGLVHSQSEGVQEHLRKGRVTGYIGFDPTADSLHVGSLLQMMGLARLQRAGHRPIALVGGGTGMIGDPSGKTVERQLLTRDQVEHNVACQGRQLERFLDFSGENAALLIDNHYWLGSLGLIEFMRDIGKHFTVNYLMAKDSVTRRLDLEEGLSVTEFSYSLLQAYDFRVLYDLHGTTLQIGGSDQWGNITSGLELIRRTRGGAAHGIVQPLITTASGTKFGKTEAGTVWLDPVRTSPFRFFQFWLNTNDADVENYLKWFTFQPLPEIEAIIAEHDANRSARVAQRRLAAAVTALVHGTDALARAERATGVLFGDTPPQDLQLAELLDVFSDVPSTELSRDRLSGEGMPVVDLLAETGIASSKGEARRLLAGGGVYLNGGRLDADGYQLRERDAIAGEVLILRKGRRQNHVVRLV